MKGKKAYCHFRGKFYTGTVFPRGKDGPGIIFPRGKFCIKPTFMGGKYNPGPFFRGESLCGWKVYATTPVRNLCVTVECIIVHSRTNSAHFHPDQIRIVTLKACACSIQQGSLRFLRGLCCGLKRVNAVRIGSIRILIRN
jgi:hypothetical protein